MIADVEAERDAIVKETAPQHPNADKIKALAELSSIGPEFATRLVGEVFYRSFANRRQLASFAGIAPSPWSSGSVARDQGISKAGSCLVRTTMIELAWLWLRFQPAVSSAPGSVNASASRRGVLRDNQGENSATIRMRKAPE